jgi:hypothetical protein
VTDFRCAPAARERDDDMFATAPPARRFLLLEVPGPWPVPDAVAAAGLRADVADAVRHQAGRSHARVLLVRRTGRHPAAAPGEPRRWAVVRVGATPAGGDVTWGTWAADDDLLRIDPADPGPGAECDRPLALVCTHGRHDLCCAVDGRPVADRVAADPRVDVWECSHLGGDRFAANVLWLPSGLLLGGVTPDETGGAVDAVLAGRVPLHRFRGRCGMTSAAQAAHWFAMRELGVDRPDLVVVDDVRTASHGDLAIAVVRHGRDRARLRLAPHWTEPHRLTCHGPVGARARTWRLVDWSALAAAS